MERIGSRQVFNRSLLFQEKSKGGLFSRKTTRFTYRGQDGQTSVRVGEIRFLSLNDEQKGSELVYFAQKDGTFREVRILKHQFKPLPKEVPPEGTDSDFSGGLIDTASSVSNLVRNCLWIYSAKTNANLDPGMTAGIGYTSALAAITGPVTCIDGVAALKTAQKTKDAVGKTFAQLSIAKGGIETTTGAIMFTSRTLSLVSLKTTSSTIGVANNVLGTASTVGYTAIFLIYLVKFARTLVYAAKWRRELSGKDDKEVVTTLVAKLCLGEEDYVKALKSIQCKTKDQLFKMVSEPLDPLSNEESSIFTATEMNLITQRIDEKMRQVGNVPGLNKAALKENWKIRYTRELAEIKMGKEAEFARIVGSKSLEMIKKYYPNLSVPSNEIGAIVELAKYELKWKIIKNAFLVVAVSIGIASFILTTVYSAGTTLLLGYILMLVMSVVLGIADLKGLVESAKKLGESSIIQQMLLVTFLITTIAITIVGAAFTGNGAMLGLAIASGASMAGIQLGGMRYAYLKHKKSQTQATQLAAKAASGALSGLGKRDKPKTTRGLQGGFMPA